MKTKAPLIVVLVAALCLSATAQASLKPVMKSADQASATNTGWPVMKRADQASITANGCRVTRNADHSVSVRCPVGRSALLNWNVVGFSGTPLGTTVTAKHPCRHAPTVTPLGPGSAGLPTFLVTQRVHRNRIDTMTIRFSVGHKP